MMPLYEYECLECEVRTEKIQRFSDPLLAACPSCGGDVKRLIHAPAVQFKGTGWYVTDYGGKQESSKGSDDEKKASSSTQDASSKADKTESKPAKEKGASKAKAD